MLRSYISLVFFLISLSSVASDFREGEWEFSVKYTISGMPANVPAQKFRQCMNEPVPTVFLQAQSCDLLELKERGRTINYKLNCFTSNGTLINEGKVRYASGRARGSSRSDLGDVAGRNSVMRYKFTGRFLGTCSTNRLNQ